MRESSLASNPRLNPNDLIQKGVSLHNLGLLSEAKVHYRRALKTAPKNANLHHLLGVLAMQEGLWDDALKWWKKASSLDPCNPDYLSNIAGIYINRKEFKRAEELASRALVLMPQHRQALRNLGTALSEQRKDEEAFSVLNKLAQIDPQNPDAFLALGRVAIKLGRIDEGRTYLEKAVQIAPTHEEALYAALAVKLPFLPMEAQGPECLGFLKQVQTPALPRADILLRLAIYFWVVRDFESVKKTLAFFLQIPLPSDKEQNRKRTIMESYVLFLNGLLGRNPKPFQNPLPDKKIFLIGDSHCLSYAGEIISLAGQAHHVVPHFIAGTKAWHLISGVQPLTIPSFRAALSFMPKGAQCWLSFGEIDCRINEGIQTVKRSSDQSLEALARQTASAYVRSTLEIARSYGIAPSYLNVPAPYISRLSQTYQGLTKDEITRHIQTIAWFNDALREAAHAQGCGVIDLYALTVNEDGVADGTFHLDDVHLVHSALGGCCRGIKEKICHETALLNKSS
ncbi:MAG: tetratricopeptide repeat protein [Bdellovibrionales bacterium]